MAESSKILQIAPKEYPIQGMVHCSVFTVKAILSAYDLDKYDDPLDYHLSEKMRASGLSSNAYIVKLLKANGIHSELKTAKDLNAEEQLNLLKSLLDSNKPVILSVMYSYSSLLDRRVRLKGQLLGHFISVWGYDDEKGVFYVYDSKAIGKRLHLEAPIGNTMVKYEDLVGDWEGSWLSKRNEGSYQYIEITPPNQS